MHHISRARSLQQERIERIAVFIDGANLYAASRTLGFDVDYKNLLAHFRQRSYLVRAYYYTALLETEEYSPLRPLVDWLGYNGYSVVTKPAKEFTDATGRRRVKGSVDIEMAVDVLDLATSLDHVVIFSGDGDLRRLVESVQRRGVRVTVISTIRTQPAMIADDLRRQADAFIDLADLAEHITRRQVEEGIRLAPQLIGDHGGLGADGGDHGHPDPAPLHRFDQPAQIAVAGEDHHMVEMRAEVEHVDRHLDVHAALDPAPPGGVGELLRRLGDHGIPIVAEPVDQRPQRRVFLGFQQGGVVVGAHQIGPLAEMAEQILVVHVEPQAAGRGVEVRAVDEDGDSFDSIGLQVTGSRNLVHANAALRILSWS